MAFHAVGQLSSGQRVDCPVINIVAGMEKEKQRWNDADIFVEKGPLQPARPKPSFRITVLAVILVIYLVSKTSSQS